MTLRVALLYSVVVSQGRRVSSADLREVAARCGLDEARTALSSGNLIFRAGGSEATLARRIADALHAVVGRAIPVHLRTVAELEAILSANPFPEASARNPSAVAVRLMDAAPPDAVLARIRAALLPGDGFAAIGRELWVAPAGGRLSDSPFVRAAGAGWAGAGTFRALSALGKIVGAAARA